MQLCSQLTRACFVIVRQTGSGGVWSLSRGCDGGSGVIEQQMVINEPDSLRLSSDQSSHTQRTVRHQSLAAVMTHTQMTVRHQSLAAVMTHTHTHTHTHTQRTVRHQNLSAVMTHTHDGSSGVMLMLVCLGFSMHFL